MVTKVAGDVTMKLADGRRTRGSRALFPEETDQPQVFNYELTSPLVKNPPNKLAPEVDTKGLHPFWSVIQQKGSKSVHNMELSHVYVDVGHPQVRGVPKSPWVTTVSLPVLYNIAALEVDDILTVRYVHDESDEE